MCVQVDKGKVVASGSAKWWVMITGMASPCTTQPATLAKLMTSLKLNRERLFGALCVPYIHKHTLTELAYNKTGN